ncbi:hypothetical protein [Candidatus Igneacidithiobacillus taiwanensis]|uniref:hypothetical protein n=1 Tax=Candidatus Igneacidithiobacillus taiwanensis TaxID=1945924 RepID=UPI00289AB8DB|nr:hypothetical protein [Candidatus Igneacidithiobacillus taiwanensis]
MRTGPYAACCIWIICPAWTRRGTGGVAPEKGAGLVGLDRVNRRIVAHRLHKLERQAHTLDIEATQIVAEKRDMAWTYKGERGYMR